MSKKTRDQKFHSNKGFQIKTLDANFADMKKGQRMLIATPEIIDGYIRNIGKGTIVDTKQTRKDLANQFSADVTCPVTTSMYLRIVAERALEELHSGVSVKEICPFRRNVIVPSSLADRLSCGADFIQTMQVSESEVE